ncbi:hypothetical protein GCM10023311_02530 [Flaviramulus aquimarinus]|uniref:Glycosyltransferase RgtA/B/C/D-like domain-containing protein n=1 Tax=Flaviramulus aquimarinus TaxID=1170456 RepID=A0ABP9ERL3_9FLAO
MNEKQINISVLICKGIILISALSLLRSLIIPLVADELTYANISENILRGQYYLKNNPSTIAPAIPFIFALFKWSSFPLLGLILNKLFNITLVILGFRYLFNFLVKQNLKENIVWVILALTAANTTSVAWFSTLYPEALAFFCFWGFIFYATELPKPSNLIKLLLFSILLVFTRYVYAVLGIVVLVTYYEYLKTNFKKYRIEIIKYSIIGLIPILIWGKYILNVEKENLSGISYFKRFEIENPILYNIKCGLGLEKHYEVDKINGIPAFISLFVPITGIRNYAISVILILAFVFGYILKRKNLALKKLFLSIILIMLGFLFAGTGFSRYWLILLPGFYLGYYFLWKKLNLKTKWFIYLSISIALICVINEIRLDILVLNNLK